MKTFTFLKILQKSAMILPPTVVFVDINTIKETFDFNLDFTKLSGSMDTQISMETKKNCQ